MAALFAVGALVAACSSSSGSGGAGGGGGAAAGCVGLCTRLNMCSGFMMSDCATACPQVDTLNEAGGCTAKYNAEVSCVLADMDPCTALDTTGDCTGQADEYVTCTTTYCDAHQGAPGCP
jgi:hypothetical protein